MKVMEIITEVAEMVARSAGWKPFDSKITLVCVLPFNMRDNLKQEFSEQVQMLASSEISQQEIQAMFNDATKPFEFKKLITPHNIEIELIPSIGDDEFSISLVKKETPVISIDRAHIGDASITATGSWEEEQTKFQNALMWGPGKIKQMNPKGDTEGDLADQAVRC